jgi:hypothetical protein
MREKRAILHALTNRPSGMLGMRAFLADLISRKRSRFHAPRPDVLHAPSRSASTDARYLVHFAAESRYNRRSARPKSRAAGRELRSVRVTDSTSVEREACGGEATRNRRASASGL